MTAAAAPTAARTPIAASTPTAALSTRRGFLAAAYHLTAVPGTSLLDCPCGCRITVDPNGHLDRTLDLDHAAELAHAPDDGTPACRCHALPAWINPAAPLTGTPLFTAALDPDQPEVRTPDHPKYLRTDAVCPGCLSPADLWLPPTPHLNPDEQVLTWLCLTCAGLPTVPTRQARDLRATWDVMLANDRPTPERFWGFRGPR